LDELDLFMNFMDGELYVEDDPAEVAQMHPRSAAGVVERRTAFEETARPTFVATHTDALDAWMYWIEGSNPIGAEKPVREMNQLADGIVDFLADGRKPGWFRIGADLLSLSDEAGDKIAEAITELLARTAADGNPHTFTTGWASLMGYPTLFVGTVPNSSNEALVAERLHRYMTLKKYQLRSDRALGLVATEGGEILAVSYLNDPFASDPAMEAQVQAAGLQNTWETRSQ